MALDNKGGTAEKAGMDRLKLEARRASGPFALFVLLSVCGLIVAGVIIRNLAGDKPWVSYQPYQVAFSDAKGVVPSRAELRLAGVKAGSVKQAKLVDGRAVLVLNLEKKYAPMYKNAKVRIRPITPLEDMYVDILSRGTPSAGKLGKNDILPAQQTISPQQIGNILDTFDSPTRTNLASLLNQLGKGLNDGGKNLRWAFQELSPFFTNATSVLNAVAERRDNFKRFVTNFGGIAQELGRTDVQLAGFVKHGQEVLHTLAANDSPFASTLAQLPGTLQTMQRSFANLRATEAVLDPALQSLKPVAAQLPSGLDSLDSLANDATPAVRKLRTPVRSLRPLAASLRPTSRSLAGVFSQLQTQAPQLDSGVVKTVPCLPTTGKLLSQFMSATKLGDTADDAGTHSSANFRANAFVGFSTFGEATTKDPGFHHFVPCEYLGTAKGPEVRP